MSSNKYKDNGFYSEYYLIKDIKKYEKFYTLLFMFETELKTHINKHMTEMYGQEDWQNLEQFLSLRFIKKYDQNKEAIKTYDKNGNLVTKVIIKDKNGNPIKKIATKDDKEEILGEERKITLGFWVELFNTKLRYELWIKNKTILKLFTNFDKKNKEMPEINQIYKDLLKIKNFRNKVFHFEVNNIAENEIRDCEKLIQKYIYGMNGKKDINTSWIGITNLVKNNAIKYIKDIKNIQNFEKISRIKKHKNQDLNNLFHNISNNISQYIDCAFKINDYSFYCKISFMPDCGGAQDNQYKDIQDFLHHSRDCNEKNTIFLAICDGDYYLNKDSQTGDETKLDRLKSLTHNKTSFVLSIEELELFLEKFI